MRGGTGWLLDSTDRDSLLNRFPPRYPDVIAHHVTLHSRKDRPSALPAAVSAKVVGFADDGNSIEALVVTIEATTDRPDGSTFHITWSLDRAAGREPKDSNDLIRIHGWTAIDDPIAISTRPAWL